MSAAYLLSAIDLLEAPVDENAPMPSFETALAADTLQVSMQSSRMPRSFVMGSRPSYKEPMLLKEEYFRAIELASRIPIKERFEGFNSFHQKCASNLINFFYRIPGDERLIQETYKFAQKYVSGSLLHYAFSVALLHRPDSINSNLQLPSNVYADPGMYFDMTNITASIGDKEVTETVRVEGSGITRRFIHINKNFTATDKDPEHKVAYFREDLGLNLHHRHWHEVYPFDADESIVNKDRRGELFYYMHQQIMARHNFERLCNGLSRAKPYENFRKPIEEAYFPKLNTMARASQFNSRPVNAVLKDLYREFFYVKLSSMELWRDRIFDAIDRGYAYTICKDTGDEILKKINEETGIDELGNTIEAARKLSWNYQYYGDMHNNGHLLFSYAHDPDHRFMEGGSVMSHTETALRDPIFYRWHAFIDDIFQHYKGTLPPYTLEQRELKGILIETVRVELQDSSNQQPQCRSHPQPRHYIQHHQTPPISDTNHENVIKTFYEKDAVDVTKGILNYDPNETKEEIYAVYDHLQNEEFKHVIEVTNQLPYGITGTVRIFLAPHTDESNLPMPFNQQRRLFIELDKFIYQLPPGNTIITRNSTQSSVTIPFEKTFMTIPDVKKLASGSKLNDNSDKNVNSYCGCGWPQHLLVGKGTTGTGFLCDLFVMITDYKNDKVEESPLQQNCCDKASISYCGVRNKKYPDRKPMGFPFDRDISDRNATIDDFMTETQESRDEKKFGKFYKSKRPRLSNMMVVPLRVRHDPGPAKLGRSLKDCGYTGKF